MNDHTQPLGPEDPVEGEEAHKYAPGPINERRSTRTRSGSWLLSHGCTASEEDSAATPARHGLGGRYLRGCQPGLPRRPDSNRRSRSGCGHLVVDPHLRARTTPTQRRGRDPGRVRLLRLRARLEVECRRPAGLRRRSPKPRPLQGRSPLQASRGRVRCLRPLDVLVCQRSNLGWGTASHRQYAAFLTGVLLVVLVAAMSIAWVVDSGFWVVLPLASPARELRAWTGSPSERGDQRRSREEGSTGVGPGTRRPRSSSACLTAGDIQDRIMAIRSGNASVPDSFDTWRRDTYQASMRQSTNVYIEQAVAAGRTR